MALIVAKRVGAFLGRVIDSLTAPAAISAAAVFPVEYVTNLKRKHEIRLAVGRVLERELCDALRKKWTSTSNPAFPSKQNFTEPREQSKSHHCVILVQHTADTVLEVEVINAASWKKVQQLAENATSVVDGVADFPFDCLTHYHQLVDSGLPHEVVFDASGNALKMGSVAEKKSVAETVKNLAEMIMVQEKKIAKTGASVSSRRWSPPPHGWVKVNTDAATFATAANVGVGAIIRDHNGSFVGARTQKIESHLYPREVEALGLKEALWWTKNLEFRRCIFETDAKVLVDAIKEV
ncbi:hypothetical protein AgCh_033792 [Apium graveolens]